MNIRSATAAVAEQRRARLMTEAQQHRVLRAATRSPHHSNPGHDVVIVGARAAGAATALLLARADLDVLVVDRGRYGADTLSTHALMRAGVVQLHRWGLLDAVIAAGTPPARKTTFTYANDEVPITIKPSHGVDALYAPRRTVLDPILVDAARAAGATFQYGITVSDVTRDHLGRVNGIEGRDKRGRPVGWSAHWVVGADGIRSNVSAAVGAPTERRGTAATAVVYGYWSGLNVDGYEWIFRPDACAGVIPTNDGQACVFAAASPGRIGRGGMDVFHQVVHAASPSLTTRLADTSAPDGFRTFTGLPAYLRRPYGPGWALVGDAGYWKDPISAHGLTDALRDAELLARAISAAATDTAIETEALNEYHATRNRLSTPLFTVVDAIAGQRWTDDEIPRLLLQLSSAMTDEVETVARLDHHPALTAGGPR
jgi:2-polyprenyl-6-methoxyphenol hydroxylase-like FAD-dependent oxidoreductase